MSGQRIGQIINNDQMAGRVVFFMGGTGFQIEGISQTIELKQFMEQIVNNNYIQFDDPLIGEKLRAAYTQQTGNDLTQPTTPVPVAPASPTPVIPVEMPPMGAMPSGMVPTMGVIPGEISTVGAMSSGVSLSGAMPGGMPPMGAMPGGMAGVMPGGRTIGWPFMKWAYTDRGGNIPEEIKGFNFGAAYFCWIWALIHGQTKLGLIGIPLFYVPFVNVAFWLYLGLFGNELAWAANPDRWSVEQFKKTQKIWNIVGIAMFAVSFVVTIIGALLFIGSL